MRSILNSALAVALAIVAGALAGGTLAFILVPTGLTSRSPELLPCIVLGVLVSGFALGRIRSAFRVNVALGSVLALVAVSGAFMVFSSGPINPWGVLYPALVLVAPVFLSASLAVLVRATKKPEQASASRTA